MAKVTITIEIDEAGQTETDVDLAVNLKSEITNTPHPTTLDLAYLVMSKVQDTILQVTETLN